MLNIEKYKDELIEMGIINLDSLAVLNGVPSQCNDGLFTRCNCCSLKYSLRCKIGAEKWLFSEYKEPEVDWSKVKVDTPILVKDILKSEWIKRYFAKYENGRVYAWKEGKRIKAAEH